MPCLFKARKFKCKTVKYILENIVFLVVVIIEERRGEILSDIFKCRIISTIVKRAKGSKRNG